MEDKDILFAIDLTRKNINEFMVQEYSLMLVESVPLIDKGIGQCIVDLIESTC